MALVIDKRNSASKQTSDIAARLASESVQLLADGFHLDAARKLNAATKLAARANQLARAEQRQGEAWTPHWARR